MNLQWRQRKIGGCGLTVHFVLPHTSTFCNFDLSFSSASVTFRLLNFSSSTLCVKLSSYMHCLTRFSDTMRPCQHRHTQQIRTTGQTTHRHIERLKEFNIHGLNDCTCTRYTSNRFIRQRNMSIVVLRTSTRHRSFHTRFIPKSGCAIAVAFIANIISALPSSVPGMAI